MNHYYCSDHYGYIMHVYISLLSSLTLKFPVAVVNSLNTTTHSSKEIAEFSFENADIRSICYCKQRVKSKLSLSSECVETKLCKPRTSFTWHPHNSCGMVWYRTLRVKAARAQCTLFSFHHRCLLAGTMTLWSSLCTCPV